MYHMLPFTVLGAVQLLRDALGGGVSRACNPEQAYIFPIREQSVLRRTS